MNARAASSGAPAPPRRWRRLSAPVVALAIGSVAFVTSGASQATSVPAARSCDPQASVRALVDEFRKLASTPEKRPDVAARILGEGPSAALELGRAIEREASGKLDRYRDRLTRAATPVLRAKRPSKREVENLRETVVALGRSPDLTKEEIVDKGDPALERLRELLWVDPRSLAESTEDLADLRQEILVLGDFWEDCIAVLEADAGSSGVERPISWPTRETRFDEILLRHETLGVALALSLGKADKKALLENRKSTAEIDPGEALGILDLNVMRLLLGLRALRIDTKLCAAGRDHAKDMCTLGFFAHESPVEGKTTPWQRASRFGTSAAAENIAQGQRSPADTNLSWFHSPGHHRNMLANHSSVGLGRFETFWTQMFG